MKTRYIALKSLAALAVACGSLWFSAPASAQLIVSSTNVPSATGQYARFYFSENNLNVAAMLALATGTNLPPSPIPGQTNYPQVWKFSEPEQANEIVLRTDIVATTDGPAGEDFPNASYAERDTLEPDDQIAWRFYSPTNQGRLYHGFYNPLPTNASEVVQFDSPTVDLPATVQYGQTWNRTVTWHGQVLTVPVSYVFTCSAVVDASGTLFLPDLGGLPALRVHEVHHYEATTPGWGLLDSHTNHHYYWLTRELGVAVQVFQFGNNTIFPITLPKTNAVLRMFNASYYTNALTTLMPGNLRIDLQAGAAVLNWDAFTNVSSYRVEAAGSLANPSWQSLGLSTNRTWSDTLTTTQRFYRVVGLP